MPRSRENSHGDTSHHADTFSRYGGIARLHECPPGARNIIPIPRLFTQSFLDNPLEYTVIGSRELSAMDRGYILTALTTRIINACLELPRDRYEWLSSAGISSYGIKRPKEAGEELFISAPGLSRGIDYLDAVRYDTDGGDAFVQRSQRGKGAQTRYRLNPEITFHDSRADQPQPRH